MLELRNVTKVVGGVEHIRDVSLTLADILRENEGDAS